MTTVRARTAILTSRAVSTLNDVDLFVQAAVLTYHLQPRNRVSMDGRTKTRQTLTVVAVCVLSVQSIRAAKMTQIARRRSALVTCAVRDMSRHYLTRVIESPHIHSNSSLYSSHQLLRRGAEPRRVRHRLWWQLCPQVRARSAVQQRR